MQKIAERLAQAHQQAMLAYQFAPSSYTFGALTAVILAKIASTEPNWINAYTDYHEQP